MRSFKEWLDFKKEMYRFRKRNKQAKREYKKILKHYGPWDYGYLLDFMQVYFKHLKDYYTAEDNVWGGEAIDLENHNYPTRLEIATKCSELLEKYDRCYENHGEEKILGELFDYLKEYLVFLWD